MSFDCYRWAKSQKGLSPPEKAVLVTIADYFNDKEGSAWPSQNTLAEETSYSRATVHRACKSLMQKGLLSWSKVMLASGHFSSNRYFLHRVAECGVATGHEAKIDAAVLHRAEPPCSTQQQKPLDKPLKRTLSNKKGSKKRKELSEMQRNLAKEWARWLIKLYPNEYFSYQQIVRDCEDFMRTSQTDEDWKVLGNGLPNPREKG